MGNGGSKGDPGTGKTEEYSGEEPLSLFDFTKQTVRNKLRK